VIGTTLPVFLGLTLCLIGGAGFLTGQALARAWRPLWQVFPYCLLLGLADRFLTWGLFGGTLLSIGGLVVDTAAILAIGLVAYRLTRVRKMVSQYPWLYERRGPFAWRKRPGS
jgi:hypothetical protein